MNEFDKTPENGTEGFNERENWRSGNLGRQLVAVLEDSYGSEIDGDSLQKHCSEVARG
ncbi:MULTISPECIES: hypothetical protein [Ferrimonas]|uniref:hypothetical protein n=1 Tax=Ferrimonas TaxID=44011 RepID=UPI000405A46D|nr:MULTISPECIES: hypothetical protein [Ferrimonas]BDY03592.1 hypothetical protein F0521_06330 [Ferrimonas sp. YFM]